MAQRCSEGVCRLNLNEVALELKWGSGEAVRLAQVVALVELLYATFGVDEAGLA